jgi:hypothetical protein
MRRARLVALLAACALLAPATPALAHGGNPNFRSVIDRVTPNVPGVSFEVLDYDSYMQLVDRGGHAVTIYGYEGEPYARILPSGTVQVNRRSPATYLNDSRFAEVTVPPIANAKAAPLWKTVDNSGTFVWHDHRMHYMSPATPPQVTDKGRKTKIFDYEIPLRIDGRRGDIQGTLFWVGSANTSKLPFVLAGVAIVLGGAALVLVVRRRRRDEGGSGGDGRGEDGRGGGAAKPGGATKRGAPAQPAEEAW